MGRVMAAGSASVGESGSLRKAPSRDGRIAPYEPSCAHQVKHNSGLRARSAGVPNAGYVAGLGAGPTLDERTDGFVH
jgi:hypothetical protein